VARAVSIHPTLNIPVFISTDVDKLDDTSGNRYVFGVCNTTPGVVTVLSKIKARQYDDPNLGAQVYQYDIWRSPFSNIQQTSGKNLGVMRGSHERELTSPFRRRLPCLTRSRPGS